MTNLSRETSIPKVFANLLHSIRGTSLRASAIRGMSWTVIGYGGSQALRLVSNLILTRLFMPEVFGIMAIVQVFMQGLAMLSDTGMHAAIIQSEHGDAPKFLNTAWTIGVLRGFALWLAACVLGYPIALAYSAPELALLIPAVGITAAISGFEPTKLITANRHLNLGRLTIFELASQAIGIIAIMILAIWIRSAWAMALGGIAAAVARLFIAQHLVPGSSNKLDWCDQSARELFVFGRWIFIGSIAGFLISQGDRLIFGFYASWDQLGVYNVGWLLGSVPSALAVATSRQVMLPLYGKLDPSVSAESYASIHRTRCLLSASLILLTTTAAYLGPFCVDLLYSETYRQAGVIVTLVSLACIPKVVICANESALLGRGDSKSFTALLVATGITQLCALLCLVPIWGVCGIVAAIALTPLANYPLMSCMLRAHRSWMPLHDLLFMCVGTAIGAGAIWLHQVRLVKLLVDSGIISP